jgi:hypothetical protein
MTLKIERLHYRNSLLREGFKILEAEGYDYWTNGRIPSTNIENSKEAPDVYEADDKERKISLTHPSVELCELITSPDEADDKEITLVFALIISLGIIIGLLVKL